MTKTLFAALAATTFLATPAFAADPGNTFGASAAQVEADVRFLADDLLEGREAGTRGYDIAAAYVASRFAGLGLTPAGTDGGWYQQMTLRTATLDGEQSHVALVRDGERIELGGDLATPRASLAATDVSIDAPMVFVGHGLHAPQIGIDAYEGVDLDGKIAVYVDLIPQAVTQPDRRAHLSQARAKMAAERGAVGVIAISASSENRALRAYNFFKDRPTTSWVASNGLNGALAAGLDMSIRVSPEGAAALFHGADLSLDDVLTLARGNEELPSFTLPGRLEARAVSTHEDVQTPNVMGMIPGADPAQADEYVVMVAHLDHVGINENAKPGEDAIYNGALDNAAGVATMLEAARMFAETEGEARPDRSMLFIAVTAEEKGLLGAEYFAAEPTVPIDSIVADLSLDMPVPLYDFTDVVAFGSEHNTMGDYIRRAAETMDITLSPDPMPEQAIFVRSDHYVFAQYGIPAVLLFTGYANGGEEMFTDFFANRYHKPGDDLNQPFNWDALARYAALNFRIASEIAEDDGRPLWYAGNFYGEAFDPDGEKAPQPE
ncbi:M28 family peptidase [Sphingomicrobium clamense]|uniref:M28 family peptidase n=1 Tax=Sphingomicrobium clamense TaxID=2851013 RepID=A0ABS6V2M5_9SPHN|nr:M28 family peptidase [Sphingomicrobium sp. B8]MBW0143741.1 M28 family peptidase [Sphingomicrobium sp. B8]